MGKISLILRSVDDLKGVGHAEVTPEDFKVNSGKLSEPEKKNPNAVSGYAKFQDSTGQTRELELKNGALWAPDGKAPETK
jgi:hypothetical protein